MTVDEILEKFRKSVKNRTYLIIQTEKNRNSRKKYGITLVEFEDFFLSINKEDLYKGPEEDYDYPGEELFIFKKELIPGVVFYVKIKDAGDMVKVLSCHEDER